MTEEKNKKEETKTTKEEKNKKEETVKEEKKDDSSEKEETKEEVDVPEKFADLVQKIENLSVLELSQLVKILEKKFGVSAAAPVAAAPVAAAASTEGEEETEKSDYSIYLKEVGDKKIEVIKAVRTITEKGLKEAKDLVDAVSEEAQLIKEGVSPEDAKKAEQTFKDAGAVVELK